MRTILVASAALALSACGGGGESQQSSDTNMAVDNMAMDQNMTMDANMAMDPMMNGTGNMAMDPMMNGTTNAVDPATQNMMKQDMNTNSPDTNLANGM
jgi:hypothetical protein